MKSSDISNKKRLTGTLFVILILIFLLILRVGYLQIVRGEEFKKEALEQWTRGIPLKPKRGIIYDRNKKKLAVSVSKDTVWVRPEDIVDKKKSESIKTLSQILSMDEKDVKEKLNSKKNLLKVKQWIEPEQSEKLKEAKIKGIEVVEDNKRYYPNKDFASHIIGHTNIDQVGQYGVERTFNEEMTGIAGKWVKTTDAVGRQLPSNYEKLYEAKDGLNVVLTLDENIQRFADRVSRETQKRHNAKNTSIIVMDVDTGEILAMANKPDYDPNKPRQPVDEKLLAEWEGLSDKEHEKQWFEMWRNFPINDNYEPGSTFKIITTASGLEESLINKQTQFYCSGRITRVKNGGSCIRAHGNQTLEEAFRNSCNVAMADIGLSLGRESFYKYIKDFGFGEKTGVALTGETKGIIPASAEDIKDINLTTISYGYGVAITPMQLITSVSSVVNGGSLMKPQIVKELVNEEGRVVKKIEPEVVRKPISKETSKKMLDILEYAIENEGGEAFVSGYRVGGKTGTARKIVGGKYEPVYVSSFIGVAPIDDPKIAVLVVVDEPDLGEGGYYGNLVAKPAAGEVIKDTLKYLNIKPTDIAEGEKTEEVIVPDVVGMGIEQAGETILESGLDYDMDAYYVDNKETIKGQFPTAGTKLKRGSIIEIYLESKTK